MKPLWWIKILLCAFALAACQPEGDTPTSGQLTVAACESIAPMIRKEVEEFQRIYPKTRIALQVANTRAAMAQLLRGEVKTVFTPRLLNDEEQRMAASYHVKVDTFRIAREGLAIIVPRNSPIKRLTLPQLGAVYRGEIRDWRELGGTNLKILPLATSRNTATAESFLREVVHDTVFARAAYVCSTSAQVLATVAQREDAIGFVGMSWLSDYLQPHDSTRSRVKTLALAARAEGEYVVLHQGTVYQNDYPLRHTLYVLSRDRSLGVAIGLISFITSAQGQKLVLNAGLVPVTMPVKLVKFRS